MIQVRMSPTEFARRAAELNEKYGIRLTDSVGQISREGVTAGYTHYDNTLTIHIVDKPFFISTEYCEKKVEEWLGATE